MGAGVAPGSRAEVPIVVEVQPLYPCPRIDARGIGAKSVVHAVQMRELRVHTDVAAASRQTERRPATRWRTSGNRRDYVGFAMDIVGLSQGKRPARYKGMRYNGDSQHCGSFSSFRSPSSQTPGEEGESFL